MFNENINLAYGFVNRYYPTFTGYWRDELYQTALIGLFKAVKTFDASRNIKISSYAYKVMSNEIGMMFKSRREDFMGNESLDKIIFEGDDGSLLTLADRIADPVNLTEVNLHRSYIEEILENIMDVIPKDLQETIKAVIKCECNNKQAGKLLGVTGQTVDNRLKRVQVLVGKNIHKNALDYIGNN